MMQSMRSNQTNRLGLIVDFFFFETDLDYRFLSQPVATPTDPSTAAARGFTWRWATSENKQGWWAQGLALISIELDHFPKLNSIGLDRS